MRSRKALVSRRRKSRLRHLLFEPLESRLLLATDLLPQGESADDVVSVHVAGRGGPWINLQDGGELPAPFTARTPGRAVVGESEGPAIELGGLSLASADFDEDGVPDLVSGYADGAGGTIALYRGNIDSLWPDTPEAQQRKADGTFSDLPFFFEQAFALPVAPEILGGGDFNADGHQDLVAASASDSVLYLLRGNGLGGFGVAERLDLPGVLTAMTIGEVDRADGLADVILGLSGDDGARLLVFAGPQGAWQSEPEMIPLPSPADSLVPGLLDDDGAWDLAVGAGKNLVTIYGSPVAALGEDGGKADSQRDVHSTELPFAIEAIAVGDFSPDAGYQTGLAVLADDGSVHLLQKPDTRVATMDDSEGEEALGDRPGEWQSVRRIATPATRGALSGKLLSTRVSSLPSDDLVLIDSANQQLHVLMTAIPHTSGAESEAADSGDASAAVPVSLDIAGAPVAVLPMRLNVDALSDLVILRAGGAGPAVAESEPRRTFTVNSGAATEDGAPGDGRCDTGNEDDGFTGICTLTAALMEADSNPGADTINFGLAGGTPTVSVASAVTSNEPVTILGNTGGATRVEVKPAEPDAHGLIFAGGLSTVRNLVLNRFLGTALEFVFGGNNIAEGNYIGTDVTGTIRMGNDAGGILISGASTNNTIGGTTEAARNVISASDLNGVEIINANSNTVQGNYIGTDVNGTSTLPNFGGGVLLWEARNNTIGGIATDPTKCAGACNLISGNFGFTFLGGHGVTIMTTESTGNQIIGNYIGTDVTGKTALPNINDGIRVIDGSDNMIGGTQKEAGNLVAFNDGNGVTVEGADTTGISILSNNIHTNAKLGIDLGDDGPTLNDGGDGDPGPNALQNFPVITSVAAGSTTIKGTLNSLAGTQFRVEVFANTERDPSGFGEGQQFLATKTVTTDGDGNVPFEFTINEDVKNISATATNLVTNATSEFFGEGGLTVNSTNDGDDIAHGDGVCTTGGTIQRDGVSELECTLRAAIQEANALTGEDTVQFDIPGGGIPTIRPQSELPTVTGAVKLLAQTQPLTGQVELDGSEATAGSNGLRITAGNSTVRGLVINRFPGNGIVLQTGGNNTLAGNRIGTDPAGTTTLKNGLAGVLIDGSGGNLIGGTNPADRNVISGNQGSGVEIRGNTSATNRIQGNRIGTDLSGTIALGNQGAGVHIQNAATTNFVGSVGGGSSDLEGNVISGNTGAGVWIKDSSFNSVAGNRIGTDPRSEKDLGNQGDGIRVENASNNTIGGEAPDLGNAIAFNKGNGVTVLGQDTTGVSILTNRIFTNTKMGIDLADNGVDLNDVRDGDLGPNAVQNYPIVVTSVDGGNTKVAGKIYSTPNTLFRIEIFSSDERDSTGFGEGQEYLNTTNVFTDTEGFMTFQFTLPGIVKNISATATNVTTKSTSEFTGEAPLVVNSSRDADEDADDNNPGDGLCYTGRVIMRDGKPEVECTLRAALQEAKAVSGKDTVKFDIPSDGVPTIQLAKALPEIDEPVELLAHAQPDSHFVQLDGSQTAEVSHGFVITGGDTTVQGFVISGFPGNGIVIRTKDGNQVLGNRIGTNIEGTQAQANKQAGILIENSSNNVIGGTAEDDRNVISGNESNGIEIKGSSAKTNRVQGNYIGTDATGTRAVGNLGTGIYLYEHTSENTIGGKSDQQEGNIISGNRGEGVLIDVSDKNVVSGNLIGTGKNKTEKLGNGIKGSLTNVNPTDSELTLHANQSFEGNLNPRFITMITGSAYGETQRIRRSTGDRIYVGNWMGVPRIGFSRQPRMFEEFIIRGDGVAVIGGSENRIGGVEQSEGNTIAFNKGSGVMVVGDAVENRKGTALKNAILSNSIYDNELLAIDLDRDGFTNNDNIGRNDDGEFVFGPGDDPEPAEILFVKGFDTDSGANNLQNFPELSILSDKSIAGSLHSQSAGTFRIDFFKAGKVHGLGYGEGEYIESLTLSTEWWQSIHGNLPGGYVYFDAPLGVSAASVSGAKITATATEIGPGGESLNTSEISPPAVERNPGVTIVTHGFQFPEVYIAGGTGDTMHGVAEAILNRTGGTLVNHDEEAAGAMHQRVRITDLPAVGIEEISATRVETIVLFDWKDESNNRSNGWAEHAADAFFAFLVKRGLVDPTIGDRNPPYHFIGHSFGTGVTSDIVERFAAYNVPVEQVTYLDAHDFYQGVGDQYLYGFDLAQEIFTIGRPQFAEVPGYEDENGYGATVWENIVFSDSYYQTRGPNAWIVNVPMGRAVLGAYNKWLNPDLHLPDTSQGDPYKSGPSDNAADHGYVADTYYLATIEGRFPKDQDLTYSSNITTDLRPTERSTELLYTQTGYAYSRNALFPASQPANVFFGTNQQHHRFSSPVLVNVDDGQPNAAGLQALEFTASELTKVKWKPQYDSFSVYNGDFSKGDGQAGWIMQGGGGNGSFTDGALRLQWSFPWIRPVQQTHNLLYVPPGPTPLYLSFDIWGNGGTLGALLSVQFDGQEIWKGGLFAGVHEVPQPRNILVPAGYRGGAHAITFELANVVDEAEAEIYLDRIRFTPNVKGNEIRFAVNTALDTNDADLNDGLCDADLDTPGEQCTFRSAIQQANVLPGVNTITFNIPGESRLLIQPAVALPEITEPVVIDGTGQTGGSTVTLDGQLAGAGVHGLRLAGEWNVIQGLEISGFGGDGLYVAEGDLYVFGSGGDIHDNQGWGIHSASGSVMIKNGALPQIHHNFNGGIRVAQGNFYGQGVAVTENGGTGIRVGGNVEISHGEVALNQGNDISARGVVSLSSSAVGGTDTPSGIHLTGPDLQVSFDSGASQTATSIPYPSLNGTPTTIDFPLGFSQLAIGGLVPGEAMNVTLALPPNSNVDSYYNYGPTPDNPAPHWYEFLFDGTTGAEILADQIVLHFVDGQRGDHDLAAEGEFTGLGGPTYPAIGVISGYVYADVNDDGVKQPFELALANVPVKVDGPVTHATTTDANGFYQFTDLPAGIYDIDKALPVAFLDGKATLGPAQLGRVDNGGFRDLDLPMGATVTDYNFGLRGLRGEFISRGHFSNSAPPASQLAMDLISGFGFRNFRANRSGTFVANPEGENVTSIGLYTADMMPVAIVPGGDPLSARVAEGEDYVLIVAGSDGQVIVETAIQPIEIECLTNPANPLDVDGSGMTTPLDVLVLVNALNAASAIDDSQVYYVDVNSDEQLTSLDVLTVINHLNTNATHSSASVGHGEASRRFELPSEPDTLTGTMRCAGLPTRHAASTEGIRDAQAEGDIAVARVGLDPHNATSAPGSNLSAADPSDDESLRDSLELEPILSDLAADVHDVWRASV